MSSSSRPARNRLAGGTASQRQWVPMARVAELPVGERGCRPRGRWRARGRTHGAPAVVDRRARGRARALHGRGDRRLPQPARARQACATCSCSLRSVASGRETSAAAFAMKLLAMWVGAAAPDPPAGALARGDRPRLRLDAGHVEVLVEAFERLRELAESDAVSPYAGRELRPGVEVGAEEHARATARGSLPPGRDLRDRARARRAPPARSGSRTSTSWTPRRSPRSRARTRT